MDGIFPNEAGIVRVVGSQLLEQQEEWQTELRRSFSEAAIAKIPKPEEALELTDGDPSAQPAVSTSSPSSNTGLHDNRVADSAIRTHNGTVLLRNQLSSSHPPTARIHPPERVTAPHEL